MKKTVKEKAMSVGIVGFFLISAGLLYIGSNSEQGCENRIVSSGGTLEAICESFDQSMLVIEEANGQLISFDQGVSTSQRQGQ